MGFKDLIRAVHGPETVKSAIDAHVIQSNAKPRFRAAGWHPSEFCDMCARRRVLTKLMEVPGEAFPPKLLRIFDYGTALHNWYQNKYLGPMGILWGRWRCSRCHEIRWGFMPKEKHSCAVVQAEPQCFNYCDAYDDRENRRAMRGGCIHCEMWGFWEYAEIPVLYHDPKLKEGPVVGHSDGLLTIQNAWRVLEMKSINERGFNLLPEPKPGHRNQAEIYGELIRRGQVDGLPSGVSLPRPTGGIVLYLGKNTSEEKEFTFALDKERADWLLSQPEEVERAFEEKQMPGRHPDCSTMFTDRAKKCDVGSFCFGGKSWEQLAQIRRKS